MNSYQKRFGAGNALRLACALLMATCATAVMANDLQDYAAECDLAMGGVTVAGFDCTDAHTTTELPMVSSDGGATCEKPPYLPGAGCYAGSRIGQQATAPNVGIVFLCRKKRLGNAPNQFDDIAVIQTNFTTGQTCFYQRLKDGTDGSAVPAPSTGGFYMKPKRMATSNNACAQCHDSGPFLRTPYVMQAKDSIPAFAATNRQNSHYSFPGDNLLHWNGKIYRVTIDNDQTCSKSSCHTMGANTIDPTVGTSSLWGRYATGALNSPDYRDPVSHTAQAHWMRPAQKNKTPDLADIAAANRLDACAKNHGGAHCQVVLWDGQLDALIRELGKYDQNGARVKQVEDDDNRDYSDY